MLLVTWNVNSLKQRIERVLELLETHRPTVVCLQETKSAPEAFPHLELRAAGYEPVDHSGGRWAGVAILARADTPPTDVTVGLPGCPVPDEARWIEATVDGVRVVSTYVVNGRALDDPMYAVKLDFLDAVVSRARELAAAGPTVVAGDINIAPRDEDVWDPRRFVGTTHTSAPERERLAALADAGLVDAWDATPERGPERFTWWDYRAGAFHRDHGLRIDLALVTHDLAERLVRVGIDRDFRKGPKPSDHAPLLVELAPDGT